MQRLDWMAILVGSTLAAAPGGTAPDGGAPSWPDRDWLVMSLVTGVDAILKTQDAESGRFGTEPWVCTDQNVLFPLAAAWAIEHPRNPHCGNPAVLQAVCRGGEALVEAQDPQGMWIFRKKDNSTWGQIHMPWTYSRWIRAYVLIRDRMPASSRAIWEQGLQLGFAGIRRYADGAVHNIAAHHAMALFIAGTAFGKEDWCNAASRFMARAAAAQDPDGFWSENYGPVVGYNLVYVDALGVYHAVSGDAAVLPALERAARFHAAFLWPDGTAVSTIDERQIYQAQRGIGNVGLSHTPEGRGYLLNQTLPWQREGRPVDPDYAAAMLLYGGTGTGVQPVSLEGKGQVVLGENKALVHRAAPWQVCLSAYCCPVPKSRWIQDRQSFIDIFHDELGLVLGGGNTKLQPYWSTFTVGDPEELRHRPGDTNPNFRPAVSLRWVPTRAHLDPDPEAPTLDLIYHDHRGRVSVRPHEDGSLRLVCEAVELGDGRFEAHLPFLKRRGRIRFSCGRQEFATEQPFRVTDCDWFEWDGLRVTMPRQATCLWPARQHNPYTKDGAAPLQSAKLVLSLPLDAETPRHEVILARAPDPARGAVCLPAASLEVISPSGTRMKPLDDLGAFFLGATRTGDAMTFSLPVAKAGTYEFLAEFMVFPRYAVVQVSVDGTPLGDPFDAYAPELDVSGPISFGTVALTKGTHEVGITVTGRNPQSEGMFISVRRFCLSPR